MTKAQIWYHQVYLRSDHWKRTRALKFKQSPSCHLCRSRKHLNIHHVVYGNLFREKMSELMTLCRDCHKVEHSNLTEEQKIDRERLIMRFAKFNSRTLHSETAWLKRKLRKRRNSRLPKNRFGFAYHCLRAQRSGVATNEEREFLRIYRGDLERLKL